MRRALTCLVALIALLSLALPSRSKAEPVEKRIALVIGNGTYQAGTLHTAVNDAGLIAQTLQAAGCDVTGARDLDQESLRRALRKFLEKASNAGPGTVAFVYLSGYGLQLEGENYFLPVEARIGSPAAIPADAIRLSDYIRPLGALELKQSIFVLDAARQNPFSVSGEPLAGGLALAEPNSGMLIAFNAAPGTVAPEQNGPYGAYAQALAEMMREGGLSLSDVFERVRLRVSELTKGAEIPWNASRSETSFVFFERSPDAPSPVAETEQNAAVRSRPLAALGASDAYTAAVDRDTLPAYQEFLAAYPDDPMARRVHAIIAARREAIIWRRLMWRIRRKPIGLICGFIPAARTAPMPVGVLRCALRPLNRRHHSSRLITTCRRRRWTNKSISNGRRSYWMWQSFYPLRRCRCISYRRHRPSSLCSLRRCRPLRRSCCRSRSSCLSRYGAIHPFTSRHHPRM
jgi:uncharacterized caspase-like protein